MRRSSKKLPEDSNQRAAEIVRLSTEESSQETIKEYLSRIGKKGGLKGGPARAKKLNAKQRREIGKLGADARWSKSK